MSKPASPHAKRKCFYCDKASAERITGVIKPKYKLAGIQEEDSFSKLGIISYVYFVGTSQTHTGSRTTLKVEPSDLTHFLHRPMSHVPTYIDIKHRERSFQADLAAKVADVSNGFKKVAKLSDAKWGELERMASNILSQRVSNEVKVDVLYSLLGQSSADTLLKNWGIAP